MFGGIPKADDYGIEKPIVIGKAENALSVFMDEFGFLHNKD